MKLFLDDVRDPSWMGYIGFTLARTYAAAIDHLASSNVTFASLDHDLTVKATLGQPCHEKTGYDVLLWIQANNKWPKNGIRVHSANPRGKKKMDDLIRQHYGRNFDVG